MNLESVTAELRPRSDAETVDLGLVLVRRDFWRLFLIWWLAMLPVVVVFLLLWHRSPGWFFFGVWWMTPLGSRLVLYHLSRKLFGEEPRWKLVAGEWWKALVRRFGYRYLWARFSPWRLMTMPVEDLESLRGEAYKARCRILLNRGDGLMIWLLIARLVLTWWLAVSLASTIDAFLPDFSGKWGPEPEGGDEMGWLGGDWPFTVALLLAHSLVEIFSMGVGFSAYINQRTWVEGWDVELALKRMGARLRKAGGVLMVVLAGGLGWGVPLPVKADMSPAEVVAEVKSHSDFTVHKVKERQRIPSGPTSGAGPASSPFSAVLAGLFQMLGYVLFYALLTALILGVAYLLWRNRHVFRRQGGVRELKEVRKAQMVMGLEVTEESLPERLTDEVMTLWKVGRRHEAMSLLYRGALAQLIAKRGLPIQESDTEHDCLRRVRESSLEVVDYFQRLTGVWLMTAYARVEVDEGEFEGLCRDWPFEERRVS